MDSEGGGLEFQRSKVRDDVRVTQTSVSGRAEESQPPHNEAFSMVNNHQSSPLSAAKAPSHIEAHNLGESHF
ncbi:hypothetical protein AAG906_038430 [Vitis piasezkii]